MLTKILIIFCIIYCVIYFNKKLDEATKNELFSNILLCSLTCLYLCGLCTQIYNEKAKYQGYVYAFPDERAKNYRLVADIEENNIKRIYFYNGGYIDFYTCDYFNSKGETFSCEPTEDERNWDFRYYGERVKKQNGKYINIDKKRLKICYN